MKQVLLAALFLSAGCYPSRLETLQGEYDATRRRHDAVPVAVADPAPIDAGSLASRTVQLSVEDFRDPPRLPADLTAATRSKLERHLAKRGLLVGQTGDLVRVEIHGAPSDDGLFSTFRVCVALNAKVGPAPFLPSAVAEGCSTAGGESIWLDEEPYEATAMSLIALEKAVVLLVPKVLMKVR